MQSHRCHRPKLCLHRRKKISETNMEGENSTETHRQSSIISKESETRDTSLEPASPSPKIPKKFINNWRQACDRTKDRTKELLKKWRTLPEGVATEDIGGSQTTENNVKWSEHVWNTWVKRSPSGKEHFDEVEVLKLSLIQRKKFEHLFISYLDLDRDDMISLADFEAFAERIRHFSDWSKNSAEYHRLKEVQRGLVEMFLLPRDLESPVHSYELLERKIRKEQISLQEWLEKWNRILCEMTNFFELPLWLQFFPKILFNAMNKSGTGVVTKDEISAFFSSILGLNSVQMASFANEAYNALTSNNQHSLDYHVFRLSFANFIFGRFPNGPGMYILGPMTALQSDFFPIDYSTLNSVPQEIEHYSPQIKSNRRSVIV